jgi:hypothetical protein
MGNTYGIPMGSHSPDGQTVEADIIVNGDPCQVAAKMQAANTHGLKDSYIVSREDHQAGK